MQPVDGLVDLIGEQPELGRAGTADDGRRLRGTVDRQAQQQALARVRDAGQLDQRLELVERLDRDRADAEAQRLAELHVRLAGSGEDDAIQRHAGADGRLELARGCHVRADAEPRQVGQHGQRRVGLDREGQVRVGRQRLAECAPRVRQHVQVVEEERRAVERGQFVRVEAGQSLRSSRDRRQPAPRGRGRRRAAGRARGPAGAGGVEDGRHRSASSSVVRASVEPSRRLTITGTDSWMPAAAP